MTEVYRAYPHALRKLDESGLTARIEKALHGSTVKPLRFVSMDDVERTVNSMEGEGLLGTMKKEDRDRFRAELSGAIRKKDSCWTVERAGGGFEERAVAHDFLLLTGYRNLAVLQKEELFDYNKFGFSSVSEFTGTVGAAIEMGLANNGNNKGLAWSTVRNDGRDISSDITGDTYGDLRIFQYDVTPYQTQDPIGNTVYYRRLGSRDKMAVEAYHNTEGQLLVSVLKYVNQENIKPQILEFGARGAMLFISTLERRDKVYMNENLFGFKRASVDMLFSAWNMQIPKLNAMGMPSTEKPGHYINAQYGEGYVVYLSHEGDMVIAMREKRKPVNVEEAVTFAPEEIDSVINGIFYQAVRGLGRTTERELVEILDYRFSPEFGKLARRA